VLVFVRLLKESMMHLIWSIELLVCACTGKYSNKRRYLCRTEV
jgi:hypothetical protein